MERRKHRTIAVRTAPSLDAVPRVKSATPAVLIVAALSSALLLGCPLPEQGVGDAGDDAAFDGPGMDAPDDAPVEASVVDGGADGVGGDGGLADATIDASGDADASVVDASADVEQPPPDAEACGSGWRTLSKECDSHESVDAGTRHACSRSCQVVDLLAHAPVVVDGGPSPFARSLGAGRHPIAVTDDGRFAVAYVEKHPTVALSLTHFSRKGTASDIVTPFSGGSTPLPESNPVIAGLPGGRFAVAYTELGSDGDELGIALRVLTPGSPPTGVPLFANRATQFSQYDPDAIFAGGYLVVAWVDNSNVATAPDIRFQVFDPNLTPATTSDQTLAETSSAESDVALAPFSNSVAAAWRDVNSGFETVRIVVAGSAAWSVGPFAPGPTGDKPALAQLDATHLLVVFSVGTDPADSGAAGNSKIQAAILDTNAQGTATGFDIAGAAAIGQSEPNAACVGARVFVSWRTERGLPDLRGYAEELWLKEVTWNGSTLDTTAAEIPLPRWDAHRAGDQRRVALAASSLPPQGALVAAWNDLGASFGVGEASEDLVIELIPAPPLRTPGGDGGL